jgi:hypothetical protein
MLRIAMLAAVLPVAAACDIRVKRAADSTANGGASATARADSGAQRTAGDTLRLPPRIVRHDVIALGSHGMSARVRWLLSPDRLSMIVVEDPAEIEADPMPNGAIVASEKRGALVQIEDVWDVAPSPDWRWLAYGRAFVLRGAFRDTVAAKRWGPVARRLAELAVRAGLDPSKSEERRREYERQLTMTSFPVSGMTYLYGAASTQVLRLDSLPSGARALSDTLPPIHFGGWRVRWVRGDTLAIGLGPTHAQDNAPSPRWDLVVALGRDSLSATVGTVTDSSRFATLSWSNGPSLDIASAVDTSAQKRIDAGAARIESRAGQIYLTRPGDSNSIPIGPGLALTATANGRYIAALAPRANRRENQTPTVVAVYEVIAQ